MKKALILGLLLAVVLSGCMTLVGDGFVGRPTLYEVKHTERDSVSLGHYTVDELCFAIDSSQYGSRVELTLQKFISKNVDFYTLYVILHATDWWFMDGEIYVEIDGIVHEFFDDDPSHNVLSGDYITEELGVIIPASLIKSMGECSKLRIEYHLEPTTVPPEGIAAIKAFYQEYVR